jgi:hypothetical protein
MVGTINEGDACSRMPKMLTKGQAAKARPEDNNMRFLVLRHVTVFIH